MHHAPLHHALCTMHHAPRSTHHLSYVLLKVVSPCRKVAPTSCVPLDAVTSVTGMVAGMPVAADAATTPLVHARHREEPRRAPPTSVPLPLHTHPPPKIRFFSPARPIKAYRSVHYAWPQTLTTPESAAPIPFGMAPRPGVTRARRADSSTQLEPPSAATGTAGGGAPPAPTSSVTSALGAGTITGLRNALELRRNQALTPYKAEAWEFFLRISNLSVKYPTLVSSLHAQGL